MSFLYGIATACGVLIVAVAIAEIWIWRHPEDVQAELDEIEAAKHSHPLGNVHVLRKNGDG